MVTRFALYTGVDRTIEDTESVRLGHLGPRNRYETVHVPDAASRRTMVARL